MAEQPKYFDIEDTQTGKRYRIETDDPNATYDEAVEYFSNLPEADWAAYEYQPKQTPAQPSKARSVSVGVELAQEAQEAPPLNALEANSGGATTRTNAWRGRPDVDAYFTELWRSGIQDQKTLAAKITERFGPEAAQVVTPKTLADVRAYDAYWKARGRDPGNLINSREETGIQDPDTTPDTMGEQFGLAAQRSAANVYNSGVGAVALGADLVGADETAESLLQQYIENNANIAYQYGTPRQTGEIEDLSSFGLYAADVFGELAPQLVGSLGTGYLGQQAASWAVRRGTQEFIEDQVQKGVTREVAEKAAVDLLRRRATQGAAAGAASWSIPQEAGRTFGTTYEQTGEKAPLTSLAAGVASGSLDAILPLYTLNRLGGQPLVNQFKQAFIRRAAVEGAKGFAIEGGTEAMQEFITSLPKSVVTGESPFTQEVFDQMFEAFFRGGLGGAGVNVATETVNSMRTPQEPSRPASMSEPGTIVVPTARKIYRGDQRTKKYKQELSQATNGVVEVINNVASGWTNAPEITVYDNFDDVAGVANNAVGVFREDGTILLNTEQIIEQANRRNTTPEAMAESVLFHEALGHNGLTQLFQEDLDAFLTDVVSNANAELNQKIDDWLEKRPAAYQTNPFTGERDANWQRIRAAEEVMAEWSEKEGVLPKTITDNILNLVKDFARRMGLNLRYSSREVRAFLAVAQRRVTEGSPSNAAPGTPKNLRTWHGSGADYDEFDHNYMGSGEGQQIYGWGTYLTDKKSIAEWYRDRFSRITLSWRGVKASNSYNLRNLIRQDVSALYDKVADTLEREADIEINLPSFVDDAVTSIKDNGTLFDTFAGDYYDDVAEAWGRGGWSEKNKKAFEKAVEPIIKTIQNNIKTESSGKLYEVELPDDARWLEWEKQLKTEPEALKALEEAGYKVLSNEEADRLAEITFRWEFIEDEMASAQSELDAIEKLPIEELWHKTNILDYYNLGYGEKPITSEMVENYRAVIEQQADSWYQKLTQLSAKEYREAKKALDRAIDPSMTGEELYKKLANKTSPKEASLALKDAGFIGNRYLANNISGNMARGQNQPDPKRVAWLEQRINMLEEFKRRYEAGDQSIGIDEVNRNLPRFKEELEKELAKTDVFNYVVFDDKTPKIINKYMEGDDPIDPDTLSGEDLVNAEDAYKLLERMTRNYKKQTLSIENLEQDALAKGVPPSAVVRWVATDPGELTRRIIMYDIAMQKLDARAQFLEEKIRTQGLNPKDQEAYLKTLFTIEELGPKIFQEQSELGRALNAIRRSMYTAKKTRNLLDVLKEYNLDVVQDPEVFYKLMAAVGNHRKNAKKDSKGKRTLSLLNLPRALMSSMDMSAPLRQGLVLMGNKEYIKAYFEMFKYAGPSGKATYDQLMREIQNRPTYEMMQKARLSFSDLDGSLSSREEDFQSDFARKIPGVKQSEQAYAGFLNKLRADMFDKYIEQYKKANISLDEEFLRGLGRFINSATGRAELPGGLQSMAPQLNALFFSPRLIMSRINLLNPWFYYRLPGPVRMTALKEMSKTMMSLGVIGTMTVQALAMFFPDEDIEVEHDPRSSDFGKIRVGNIRYDLGGGFLQYITLGARTVAWLSGIEAVKTSSGELEELGPEQGQTTYGETVLKFFRNKLSPNASIVVNTAMEENVIGEPYTVGSALSSMLPLHMQSVYDAAQEYDPVTAGAVTAPGFFGVGVNIYTPYAIDKEQELDAPESITVDEEEYELTEAEREKFKATRNNYFRTFVEEFTLETGKAWDDLSDEEKEEIIEEAKEEAQRESRLDMIDELGL